MMCPYPYAAFLTNINHTFCASNALSSQLNQTSSPHLRHRSSQPRICTGAARTAPGPEPLAHEKGNGTAHNDNACQQTQMCPQRHMCANRRVHIWVHAHAPRGADAPARSISLRIFSTTSAVGRVV
ncbi:hypothetical protein EVAR_78666_1 [Eumeta japonica]|uniref:Uncharacterized protein n=1 Tax=Eumeta variegata TaxID=151549 RepID=A0A4C1U826_EUMVA|nr:hypothetical protein EVAR_78666_1 [Eumeta japonica]